MPQDKQEDKSSQQDVANGLDVQQTEDSKKAQQNPQKGSQEGADFMQELEKALEPGLTKDKPSPAQGKGENPKSQSQAQQPRKDSGTDQGESEEPEDYEKMKDNQPDVDVDKLKEKAKEYEEFAPLLQEMKQDPNLVNHVRDYFAQGGEAPQNLKEQLGLGEDFIFDADEAFSDPESDSAQLMQASIDNIVRSRVNKAKKEMQQQVKKQEKQKQLKEKHDMSDEEFQEMKEWAQNRDLTQEDILYLYQKEQGDYDQKIQNDTKEDMRKQMNDVQDRPNKVKKRSAQQGSEEESIEDKVFDAMMGADNDVGSVFDV